MPRCQHVAHLSRGLLLLWLLLVSHEGCKRRAALVHLLLGSLLRGCYSISSGFLTACHFFTSCPVRVGVRHPSRVPTWWPPRLFCLAGKTLCRSSINGICLSFRKRLPFLHASKRTPRA